MSLFLTSVLIGVLLISIPCVVLKLWCEWPMRGRHE